MDEKTQQECLSKLKSSLPEEVRSTLLRQDYMRFLKSRGWNIEKTTARIMAWHEWYYKTELPGLGKPPCNILDEMDPKEAMAQEFLAHANLREDKLGHPVYFERTGCISSNMKKVLENFSVDELVVRHVRQMELMMLRLQQASFTHGKIIGKQVLVYDLKGMKIKVNSKALTTFKRTLVVDEQFYPERLHKLVMINAPGFFTGIWKMIKPWLDPVTANKIQILGTDYQTVLHDIVDPSQLPAEFGGTGEDLDWTWPKNWSEEEPAVLRGKHREWANIQRQKENEETGISDTPRGSQVAEGVENNN